MLPNIPGLQYVPEYLDPEMHDRLLAAVDLRPGKATDHRQPFWLRQGDAEADGAVRALRDRDYLPHDAGEAPSGGRAGKVILLDDCFTTFNVSGSSTLTWPE